MMDQSDSIIDRRQVVNAEAVEEVLTRAASHARDVHWVVVMPEMAEEIAGKIEEG